MCKSLIDQYFSTNFTTGTIGSTTGTIGATGSTNGTISTIGCWNFQGSLVANGTNGANGKITYGTIGRTPNVAYVKVINVILFWKWLVIHVF